MGSVPQNAQKQIQRKKKTIQINSLKLLYVRSYQRKPVCESSSVQVYYRLAPGYGTDLTWIDTEGCDLFLARMSSFVFQLCGSGGHRTSFGFRKRGDHEGIGRMTHWLCRTAPRSFAPPNRKSRIWCLLKTISNSSVPGRCPMALGMAPHHLTVL